MMDRLLEGTKNRVKPPAKPQSIERFLHSQFIMIGFVAGALIGMLGLFATYEGVQLAKFRFHGDSIGMQLRIILTAAAISVSVFICIMLVDILLKRIALRTVWRISEPIGIMDEAMRELAGGHLEDRIVYGTDDEFAGMIGNTKAAMQELRKYIGSISQTLCKMSEKNVDIEIKEEYAGDFSEIRSSLLNIVGTLNDTLFEMKTSFAQVRDGAGSLAETAQSMADGAVGQSEHIQKLLGHIGKVASSVHENTMAAENAEKLAQSSLNQMEGLTAAMDLINQSSQEISGIIGMITDIAFQTNLLALNAAVQAAHAGPAGKGFAVVADEVGKLATSSSAAADHIKELIQKSISAVDNGVAVTGETARMLSEISGHITVITDSMREQDKSLKDMVDSATEIGTVTDQNTAAAQESSAFSQQLFGYTESVMSMIEKYNIRN